MYEVEVYKLKGGGSGIISPLPVQRDWMDNLPFDAVYRCMPMTLANQMGYGISFPEDISFTWDGTYDSEENHGITVHSGHTWIHKHRGWATLAISTGLRFKTDKNTSMLAYPIPNKFYEGFQVYTTLLSTSFFKGAWEITLRLTEPNKKITIPAYTQIAAFMPFSAAALNNSKITVKYNERMLEDFPSEDQHAYVDSQTELGKGTGLYRKGIDLSGKKLGEHEISKFTLFFDDSLDREYKRYNV